MKIYPGRLIYNTIMILVFVSLTVWYFFVSMFVLLLVFAVILLSITIFQSFDRLIFYEVFIFFIKNSCSCTS